MNSEHYSPILFPYDKMDQFNEFMKQYNDKSEKYIIREILKVKQEVSKDVIDKHIKNLDLLSKMEVYSNERTKENVEYVKKLLSMQPTFNRRPPKQGEVETEYCNQTSLLLWFLILVCIW